MKWVIMALIVLAVIIAVCVIVKVILYRKLQNIDGFGGVHKQNKNKDEGTVIGYFGDDE